MRRRDFIAGLAGTTAGWTLAARAQQPTVPIIGFVDAGSADASADNIPQKVVLYEEDPRDSAGKSYVGSVVWRSEVVPPSPGQKPNIAARADIEIPAQNISIRWSLRRNDDKQLPASHTVEIVFTLPPDFPHGGISNIPGVLMKQGETTLGALNGVAVKVTTNFFLIGLSSVDADMQRNIQLLIKGVVVRYSGGLWRRKARHHCHREGHARRTCIHVRLRAGCIVEPDSVAIYCSACRGLVNLKRGIQHVFAWSEAQS